MPSRIHAAFIVVAMAGASPAEAAWLHCTAQGTDAAGTVAFHTTAVNVGAVQPAHLEHFQTELLAKVAKVDPDARNVHAVCSAQDDQNQANSDYSHALENSAHRLGWEHVTVLVPEDWMQDGEIVAEPSRP